MKPSKRVLDISIAALILIAALPITTIAAMLLLLTQGPPILFRQVRPGLLGRPFVLLKLRTMRPRPEHCSPVPDDQSRLTNIGKLVRRLSIDEIPQLINVLRGDMSLVGPRPLLMEYVPLYTAHQWRRHEVPPGITGLAQVRGRNALSWEEKFELDVWYVDNWSMLLDFRIMALTIKAVVVGKGVAREGHATTPPFLGTPEGTGSAHGDGRPDQSE